MGASPARRAAARHGKAASGKTPEPEPAAPGAAGDPSGRLLLRMPRSLHGALAQIAERDGTSLNQLITGTLASAIGWSGDGAGQPPAGTAARGPLAPARASRTLLLVLIANAIAVGLAALAAIGLLLYAWQG